MKKIDINFLEELIVDYLDLLKTVYDESVECYVIDTNNEQYLKLCFTSRADSYMECMAFEIECKENDLGEHLFYVDIDQLEARRETLKSKLVHEFSLKKKFKDLEERELKMAEEISDLLYVQELLEDFNELLLRAENLPDLFEDDSLLEELGKTYGLLLIFLDEKDKYFRILEERYNKLGLC